MVREDLIMDDSILNTIKKMLGLEPDYDAFDTDVIVNINMCLSILNQLGIKSPTAFKITSAEETWSDILGDRIDLEMVKNYIYLKTRLMFDPPANSFTINSINEQIKEIEWRIIIELENGGKEEST